MKNLLVAIGLVAVACVACTENKSVETADVTDSIEVVVDSVACDSLTCDSVAE